MVSKKLITAAQAGNRDEVVQCLQAISPRDQANDQQIINDALLETTKAGYADIVKLFLDHHASVEAKNEFNQTPLHLAVEGGYVDIVKLLLDRNASVEAKIEYEHTPLHVAVQEGYVDIVKLLLDHNAFVEAKTAFGYTPLNIAVKDGHVDIVELLLDYNAFVEARNGEQTPLHEAAINNQVAILQILLTRRHAISVNIKDEFGYTPLHWATKKAYIDTIDVLIEQGKACIDIKNKEGETPLRLLLNQLPPSILYRNPIILPKKQVVSTIQYLVAKGALWESEGETFFEDCISLYNQKVDQTKQIDSQALKQWRDGLYNNIRTEYKCNQASDRVVAYFLGRQSRLYQRVIRLVNFLISWKVDNIENPAPILKAPVHIHYLFLQAIFQIEESSRVESFSAEDRAAYMDLVQSFFKKQPLKEIAENLETDRQAVSTSPIRRGLN